MTIRAATFAGLPVILALVGELAAYDREPEAARGTVEGYRAALDRAGGEEPR